MTFPLIFAIAWAVILGLGGGLLTKIGSWYYALQKPSWQPPDWLFGPAWTIILGLAAWAMRERRSDLLLGTIEQRAFLDRAVLEIDQGQPVDHHVRSRLGARQGNPQLFAEQGRAVTLRSRLEEGEPGWMETDRFTGSLWWKWQPDRPGLMVVDKALTSWSSPQVSVKNLTQLSPSMDMFAVGVILFVMLCGAHPFDLEGTASNEELNQRVLDGKIISLRDSPFTSHLSPSAIDLIEKLVHPNPRQP